MKILINKLPVDAPDGATLAEIVATLKPAAPFAAAVNMQFVPKASYSQTALQPGDDIEIIRPVTGG